MAGFVIPSGLKVRTRYLTKSHVATRIGAARVYTPQNLDVHATSRLTLDVITQNLTVTLGTALSETLNKHYAREST